VIELLEDDSFYYIATELCEGGVMYKRLTDLGKFNEKDAAYFTM
jgi:hypothetical protein